MPVMPRLALRNLSRQKKRSFLLGGAIAFGIMIVTLINGFAGAFINNVSENFSYLMAGHLFVQGSEKTDSGKQFSVVRDDDVILAAVENLNPKPVTITRTSEVSANLVFEGKSIRQTLTGLDIAASPFLAERLALVGGSWQATTARDALIISEKVAAKLNIQPGDRLLAQFRTATGQNNVADFTIAAISADSGIIGSVMAYANLKYVNSIVGLEPGEYMSVGVMLGDLKQAPAAAASVQAALVAAGLQVFERSAPEQGATTPFQAMMQGRKDETWNGVKYRVTTIDDILSQARQIVTALDSASMVILVVLFAIVMIGITNTFRMVMYERIREIGTMRAVGVQRSEIRSLFMFEALFLALAGAVAGILLALGAMGLLSLLDFGMDSPAFILMRNGHLSFYLPPLRAAANVVVISLLTLAAAFFPARAAARMKPAEALRTLK